MAEMTNSRRLRTVSLLIAVCLVSLPAQAQYGGGSGTADDPYQIWTAEQMNTIGANPNDWDRHFKLMADIDLSTYTGTQFNMIGLNRGSPFMGVFDGNGHRISKFTYYGSGADYIGLFRYVTGAIKDLALIDPCIDAGTGDYVGSLVGHLRDGTITGCYVEGGSVTGDEHVGGLVGAHAENVFVVYPDPNPPFTISNCHSTSSVQGNRCVGGLVGSNDGTIVNCYATGIACAGESVGGLVGQNGVVKSSISVPIGLFPIGGTIVKCFSTGAVSGRHNVGGLVGENGAWSRFEPEPFWLWYDAGTITDCYASGPVSGQSHIGGLVGQNILGSTVVDCYSTGMVSGNDDVGGLVADNWEGDINSSFWDIDTAGQTISAGGTGKTTAELKTASTFLEAGWDFVNVWGIGENQTYPYLRKYSAADINQDETVNFDDLAILANNWLAHIAP